MSSWPFDPPQAVHVVASDNGFAQTAAAGAGAATFVLDLSSVESNDDLLDLFNQVFTLPYPARSINAAIDLLTDPLTDELKEGYLVVVTGCDAPSARGALEVLADVAPFVAERSRTIHIPYVWVFVAESLQEAILKAARAANTELDEVAELGARPLTNSGGVALFVAGVEVAST